MKKALLVVDYIKGIAETGSCSEYLRENPRVIENTNTLIRLAREKGVHIVHVRLAFTPDYEGLPRYAPSASYIRENRKFLLGTPETEFIAGIDHRDDDYLIDKKYGDPFHGSRLDDLLRSRDVEGVVFTGVATDNAILHGSDGAMGRGYHVTVVSDACGAPTAKAHEDALAMMKGRTVTEFLKTEELQTMWKK